MMIEFQVFDALVYLVPGMVLMTSFAFCLGGDALGRLTLKPDTFLGIVAFIVLAFSIGFFVHLISGPVFVILNKVVFGISPLHHVTDVFTERQDMLVLKAGLEKQLGVETDDFTDLYRYATYAVISSDNPLANRIDRLQSLALMSRNLTITVPAAALVFFAGMRLWQREKWVFWIPLGLSPIVALILHYGAWQFSVATVLATYRSAVIIF